ncbi:hypothetical protein FRB99_001194 [Tulasnella sp. 403]|nr:hypothetical protein FRB99_001194 [Tulasnella sp. 403]
MASPVRNRRKVDHLMSPPSLDEPPWHGSPQVFTSALAVQPLQRRNMNHTASESNGFVSFPATDLWANGWQDQAEDDEPIPSSSSSNSRDGSLLRPPISGLASLVLHPLSPPRSHESRSDKGPVSRLRGSSDATYNRNQSILDWRDLKGSSFKGKDRLIEEEREVFIHEVLPTDSLAGVALKYGVQLAELRKVNKLWASDTIHLRKQLYIPVDSTKWKSSTLPNLDEGVEGTARSAGTTGLVSDLDRHRHSREQSEIRSASEPRTVSGTPVRRVPVSELSFFPPPTVTSRLAESDRSSPNSSPSPKSPPLSPPNKLHPLHYRVHGSNNLPIPSFASLSSHPIASSLRGLPALFTVPSSRLSLSSESTSEPSEDLDVELDNAEDWRSNGISTTPRRRSRTPRGKLSSIDWASGSTSTIRSPPYTGDSLDVVSVIQTRQPRPSPSMELPGRSKPP